MEESLDLNDVQTNAAVGFTTGEEHGRKIIALTAEIKDLHDGRPYRIKENGDIETVERLGAQPTFRRGDVSFYEALSFSRFVKRFRNGTTVIFADALRQSGPVFTAILDYHTGDDQQASAVWDLFRASLPLRHTPAWLTWAAANGKPMEQAEFAQFLEDNIVDIAEPAGALLVEIARTLEAAVDVSWQSHIRAENGAHRLSWLENVTGAALTKDGRVDIPAEITLALQPFEGAKVYAIKARFRYRLAQGKVKLWFDLVRMQDVLKEAFNDELLKIDTELNVTDPTKPVSATDTTVTPIYNGPAPEAQQPKD